MYTTRCSLICQKLVTMVGGAKTFLPVRFGGCWGRLLHYLAFGSLLFIFLWLVKLFRTQLLASDASLELIAPFLCSQLHSSPSSSGPSSSSSSSFTSLSSSLRSSRSTFLKENPKYIKLMLVPTWRYSSSCPFHLNSSHLAQEHKLVDHAQDEISPEDVQSLQH